MPVERKGKLNGIETRLNNALRRGLLLSGKLVAQRATRKAPRDTGRLKRSITHGQPKQVGRLAMTIDVGTNVEYAAAQEFGSGLHATQAPRRTITIIPVRRKYLKFQVDGKTVFTRHVNHPGVKPQPYLHPAEEESRDDVRKLILKNVIAAFK